MILQRMPFFVKDADGETIARTAGATEAVMLVGCLGSGYMVTANGKVGWTEGREKQSASESYDFAALEIMHRTGAC